MTRKTTRESGVSSSKKSTSAKKKTAAPKKVSAPKKVTAPKPKAAAPKKAAASKRAPVISDEQREALIAKAAFYRAEARGFVPGGEVEDWLIAEREVDAQLATGQSA